MSYVPINAVIIDDEKEPGKLLATLLRQNPGVEVNAIILSPQEGIEFIVKHNPDVVFLDVKMPEMDGFEVLDELRKYENINPEIVFTTAYNEFALKAFEYSAFAYLLKPIDPEKLNEVINRYSKWHNSSFSERAQILLGNMKKLVFKTHSGIVFVDPSEVVYCEADGNYTQLHISKNQKETITQNLGQMECSLLSYGFFRISRSFLINPKFLSRIEKRNCVLFKNGEFLYCEIAREKVNELIGMVQSK